MVSHMIVAFAFFSASSLTAAQEQSSNESIPPPLRPALATQQLPAVSEGSETCSSPEAQNAIEEVFQQFLQEEILEELTCDSAMLGKIENCPAANCSRVFSINHIFRFPGYYWITAHNGSSIQVYCDFESEQFPYATAEIDNMADNTCPSMEQRKSVQDSLQENIQPQLSLISSNLLTCTPEITGLVAHCPVNSCSQLFDLIHEGFLRLSDYYWLQAPDGDVTEVYCNRNTMQPEYSSCQQLFQFETVSSGTYTIRPSGGSPVTVYCDMDNEECGGGVWTRVASYNYSDPNTTCPGDWNLITSPIRACGRSSPSGSCSSAIFSSNGIKFSSVCGRVIAIQFGSPSAFLPYHTQNQRTIDGYYVEGVSITYGNPRQHVWTFAAYASYNYAVPTYVCSCSHPSLSVPSVPSFVGNNYFCDTGGLTCCPAIYFPDDPLWDGHGCGGPSTCCSLNIPPWFSTVLPDYTSDDIEVRICDNQPSTSDNTPINILDLYIQ